MNWCLVGMTPVGGGLGLFALGSVIYAGETKPVQTVEEQAQGSAGEIYSYIALEGPLKFVAFTRSERPPDNRVERSVLLVADTVRLAGEGGLLGKGEGIYPGDTIESGVLRSVGGTSTLLDSIGNRTTLANGQNLIVVVALPGDGDPIRAIDCETCIALANTACPNGIKSVDCGPDNTCKFECFPTPDPTK